jgi:hypothetical protein
LLLWSLLMLIAHMLVLLLLLLLLLLADMLLLLCHQAHITQPAEAGNLLQLAFNCSDEVIVETALKRLPRTTAAAATDMPALLEPDVARKLLLTAATRQHAAYWEGLPALQ